MARIVLTDVVVTINSVDLSDHIASVTLSTSADAVETTAFGQDSRTRVGGLKDNSVTFDFHQDFAATEVEATIYPLIGTSTAVTVKPTGNAVGADNPEYQFNALVTEWTPLNGAVGELATASVTWPVDGSITKDVTP
jgi:hypothetical protein